MAEAGRPEGRQASEQRATAGGVGILKEAVEKDALGTAFGELRNNCVHALVLTLVSAYLASLVHHCLQDWSGIPLPRASRVKL